MKKLTTYLATGAATALLTTMALLNGCTGGDSAEGIVRSVGLIVEGFYMHSDPGSFMVQRTSGADVTSLDLSQNGDLLQGFDNNGVLFTGTIGNVTDTNLASFIMEGQSTAGQPATISGTISVEGTTATMRGTWIEPTLASAVFGVATVPTNAPPPAAETNGVVAVNPTLASVVVGNTTTFNATGGNGSYTWQVSSTTLGNFTSISGTGNSMATYQANATGNNTVTVRDSAGGAASATVRQTAEAVDDPGDGATAVTVSPSLTTIDSLGGSASFTASGGSGTFRWSVGNGLLGQFSSITGTRDSSATYVALGTAGQNTITVTDSATGSRASATINQIVGGISTNGGGLTPPGFPGL